MAEYYKLARCWNCHEQGHIQRYCPQFQGNYNWSTPSPQGRPME
jgi:Fe-S oxidoreductase